MKMSGRRPRFAGRGRERAWWLLVAVVLAAVLWAIAEVLGWPLWARAVLAGLAAAAPLVVAELRARAGQDDTLARLVERWVAVSAGHGRLLRVRDVELDQLRVHAARVQVPYIERDQQDKLEEAVGPGQAALVVGHSMSGKTRLAAEVVKRKFPEALLLPVESGKALRELFDVGLNPASIVVWLDDLERFLGADGLTVGLLDRLTAGGAIVVATIRVEQRETYRPQDKLRPPEWEVLQRFSEISLQRRLTDPELGRVRATVNDPGVLAAVDHYGLAEYLGAGPEALDKFEKGEIANPIGHALVWAAVDWRRTALTRPVSEQVLAKVLPTYLADRLDVPRTNQAIDAGLVWATAKINETVALLNQVFTGSNGPVFEAFDYLVDQLTRTGTPVPDPMWTLALEQAKSAELIEIGRAAYQAKNSATAVTAWRQAADKGDSEVAPRAAVNLGVLLEEQGDVEGARAAFQRAIDSGHADVAPRAAVNLGILLEEQGDVEGARAAFQRAIVIGLLLKEQGDVEGAKAAFQRAIDSGHADVAPRAAVNLGLLLKEQGDVEGAKAAFQRAIDSGHADVAPRAAVNLGLLLLEQGNVEGAVAAFQRAVGSGHRLQLDDAAVLALQKTIAEVATRSLRIREWWHLESHLRMVAKSFKSFSTALQSVNTLQEYMAQETAIESYWRSLQDIDLPEISIFAQNLEHIQLPVVPGTPNYPDIRVAIDVLVKAGNDIQDNLNAGDINKLKAQSTIFQKALVGLLANRRIMMEHEVEQLYQVAYQLRAQLNR